jgi:hypothetical protein
MYLRFDCTLRNSGLARPFTYPRSCLARGGGFAGVAGRAPRA